MNYQQYPLQQQKIVAIATDRYLTPTNPFGDPANLPGVDLRYGQDLTSGNNRPAPRGQSVGTTEAMLVPRMQRLLAKFAGDDKSGMAKRLFDAFLRKQERVTFFDDPALNVAAAAHRNIQYFCDVALSAPNSPQKATGKKRIHQALKEAKWDVKNLIAPTDLGVPAFNDGNKALSTGDFNNGLGLMINGVQYAYVVARFYHYDRREARYCIGLRFIFYDVFGLDDDDVNEFGADSDSNVSDSKAGITAWWQLQHQFGYHPLVTRIVVERAFEAAAT